MLPRVRVGIVPAARDKIGDGSFLGAIGQTPANRDWAGVNRRHRVFCFSGEP